MHHLGFLPQSEIWLQKYKRYLSRFKANSRSKLDNKLIITDVHDLELCTIWPALL